MGVCVCVCWNAVECGRVFFFRLCSISLFRASFPSRTHALTHSHDLKQAPFLTMVLIFSLIVSLQCYIVILLRGLSALLIPMLERTMDGRTDSLMVIGVH